MLECVSFQARKHSGSVLRDSEGHAVKHHISCVEVTTMFLLDHSFQTGVEEMDRFGLTAIVR